MKLILITVLALLTQLVYAGKSSYLMSARFIVDGKVISAPRISTQSGKSATVVQSDEDTNFKLSIQVLPNEIDNSTDTLNTKYNVEYIKGENKVVFAHELVAKLGSENTLVLTNDSGEPKVEMIVKAIRQ